MDFANIKDDDFKYWIALDSIQGLGAKRFELLLRHFGSLSAAWRASEGDLVASRLNERLIARIKALRAKTEPDALVARLEALKMKAICRYSERYPAFLKEIYDPPNVLYHSGALDFDGARAVAIVGTRLPTAYGKSVARDIAGELARAGIVVISGLARGIDSIAHEATLDADGKTIAVLGGALNKLYPADAAPLARRIVQNGGAVVSEFPPDVRARREHFPRRNRIISGMAAGVIAVEGKVTSGALITARLGLEQNREVFAVPGNIGDEKSGGPNDLIKENQAKLITSADDVLDELNLSALIKPPEQVEIPHISIALDDSYGEVEKRIVEILADANRPMHIDEITNIVDKAVSEVNTSIVMLELGDKIKRVAAMTFAVA